MKSRRSFRERKFFAKMDAERRGRPIDFKDLPPGLDDHYAIKIDGPQRQSIMIRIDMRGGRFTNKVFPPQELDSWLQASVLTGSGEIRAKLSSAEIETDQFVLRIVCEPLIKDALYHDAGLKLVFTLLDGQVIEHRLGSVRLLRRRR